VSWSRSENRDENGNFRTRPWIQSVTARDRVGRPVKRFQDSALVTAAQENQIVTQMTWAGDHRLQTVQGSNGAVTEYVFDGYGFLYKTIVDAGVGKLNLVPSRYFYDADGLVTEARNALGHGLLIHRYTAGLAHGLVEKVIDPALLNEMRLSYDTHRRLSVAKVHAQNNDQRITTLRYDAVGQLDRVTVGTYSSSLESSRIQVYDDVGRLVELGLQSSSADMQYTRGFMRAFDSYGRMTYQRDRLSDFSNAAGPLSNQVSFTYDPLTGLPLKMIEREIEQAPGEFGPLTPGGSHVTRIFETHLQHDLLDRVTRVDQMPEGLAGDPVSHKYFHDSLGSLVRFQDTLTAELQWVFDGLGDVRARTEKGVLGGLITTTTEIDYVTGLVTRTDAENRVSRFYHDKAWRLDKQELPGAVAGSPSFSHDFVYDAASRLERVINGNGAVIERGYDQAGRLKNQWVRPTPHHSVLATWEEYDYNNFGNVSKARTYMGEVPHKVLLAEVWLNEDGFGRRTSEFFIFGWFQRNVNSSYGAVGGAEDFWFS
jgi:hypothetical protein